MDRLRYEQWRSYRRGLVLGLTLAEALLLLLFSLILAVGFVLFQIDTKAEERTKSLAQCEKSLSEEIFATALVAKLIEKGFVNKESTIDDNFQHLVLRTEESEQLRKEYPDLERDISALKELNEVAKRAGVVPKDATVQTTVQTIEAIIGKLSEVRKKASRYEQLIKGAREYLSIPTESEEQIEVNIERALIAANRLAASGGESAEGIQKCEAQQAAHLSRIRTLEAQVLYMQEAGKGLGRGWSYPPCWINPTTKKPDYIFRTELTEAGIVVSDITPSHQRAELEKLPISEIPLSIPLSAEEFQRRSAPLFRWSQEHNCRHFVVVVISHEHDPP